MRGNGRVYRPVRRGKRLAVWRLDYSVHGVRYRETTGTTSKREAFAQLRAKLTARQAGKLIGRPERVTLADLHALVTRQYALDGRRSADRVANAFANVERLLTATTRAPEITAALLDDYAAQRLAEGAARATVNLELAAVRRGFRLAIEKGQLAAMPVIKLPRVQNARSGFLSDGDFAALLLELPADVRDLVVFLRATGWRRDEGRLLLWAAVDQAAATIRLEQARSKSGQPRCFPYGGSATLAALLDERWERRDGLYVFHRGGQPLGRGALRSAWRRATTRAGLAGRLLHDLRRDAARAFRSAGVSEGEIMKLCGWETRSMFDRYNVISEADLAAAVAKRDGTPAAHPEPSPNPSGAVS
jgi:site-specific recombinase XerD